MNCIQLVGRLTRDPELKKSNSGKAYIRFSLAVDRPFSKDEVDFINCVGFGKTAELIGEYTRKGHKLGVVGALQQNSYESNGEKRTTYIVMINSFDFLENRNASAQEPEYHKTTTRSEVIDMDNDVDDDFPF